MSLFITSLNSGSNGNCYYVGNDEEGVLIDAGISCREIEKRMSRLGLPVGRVKAIFVSHEHGDHIAGVAGISKKFRIPVFFTISTFANSRIPIEPDLLHYFVNGSGVQVGSLNITAFKKYHDACDPHSFIVCGNDVTVGIFTDIGLPCEQLVIHFKRCHAAFLEANYDEDMLLNGNYPWHLKKRISGGNGHLSNRQALRLFVSHRPAFMSHLVLSHLSKNNNCPDLVERIFKEEAGDTAVIVASRYHESGIHQVTNTFLNRVVAAIENAPVLREFVPFRQIIPKTKKKQLYSQLPLFQDL